MKYTLHFDFESEADTEPFRSLFEDYIPAVAHREANAEGAISSLNCVMPQNHKSNDKGASAAVFLRSGKYHCSVCGTWDAFGFLTEIMGVESEEARIIIEPYLAKGLAAENTADYSVPRKDSPLDFVDIAEQAHLNLSPDLPIVQAYMSSHGLEYQTLVDFKVGYAPAMSKLQPEALLFPYYVAGTVPAIRVRFANNTKRAVRHSQFVPYGIDADPGSTVLLCEGESDTLKAYQVAKRQGFPVTVLGTPGARFNEEWTRDFAGVTKVFIIPQADQPSHQYFARKAAAVLGSRATIVELPWRRDQRNGKDICDWLKNTPEEQFIQLFPIPSIKKAVLRHTEMLEVSQQPVPWIVNNLIAEGDTVLVGGTQKAMKTFLTLFLVKHLVHGTPVFGNPEWSVSKPRKVFFVEEEGALINLAKRAANIIGELPEPLGDNVRWHHRQRVKLDEPESLHALEKHLAEYKPDILVLDPLQRLHSQDENAAGSKGMGRVWDALKYLTNRFDHMAIILIHHFSRSGAEGNDWNSFRGSTQNAGEADALLAVSRNKKLGPSGETLLNVYIDGRDVPQVINSEGKAGSVTIALNTDDWTAELQDFSIKINRVVQVDSPIWEVLTEPMAVKEIEGRVPWPPNKIRKELDKLIAEGHVIREKGAAAGGAGWIYLYRRSQ